MTPTLDGAPVHVYWLLSTPPSVMTEDGPRLVEQVTIVLVAEATETETEQ